MKCIKCGSENPDGFNFCQECGSSLEVPSTQATASSVAQDAPAEELKTVSQVQSQEAPTAEEKTEVVDKIPPKTKSNIFFKVGLGAVFVVVIIAFLCMALSKGDKYDMVHNNYVNFYEKDEDKSIILYNNKEIKDKVDGNVSQFKTNYDNTFAAFIASSEDEKVNADLATSAGTLYPSYMTVKGTLYTLSKSKLTKVEEDVTNIFAVADTGKAFAYKNSDGILYFYSNGKTTKVAEDAYNVIISPDGKSIVYSVTDEDDKVLYYFNGKKSQEIGENITAKALSNGGKYVYYTKEDGDLYVASAKKPENSEKIASSNSGKKPEIVVTNKDCTQIIYSLGDKSYFVNKGNVEKKVKVANTSYMRLFTPDGATGKADDLRKQFYIGDNDDLYYVNKKAESEKIASSLSGYQMSEDGKTVYYSKGEDLYILKTNKINNAEKIADDSYDFKMLSNGKAAYYVDDSNTLFYIKGKGKSKRVTDDVSRLTVTHDGIALFLKDVDKEKGDGTLYYTKNGGKVKKIADDVYSIYATPYATYYLTNFDSKDYSFDFYLAKSGTKFKVVAKGVTG